MCGVSASAASEPRGGGHARWHRGTLLAFGGIALVAGVCTGLTRLGFGAAPLAALAEYHGPLFICGMFGTLTTLERAVASRVRLDYAAPALCAAGTLLVLCGGTIAGALLYVLASLTVSVSTVRTALRHPTLFTSALAASSLFWLTGNVVWFAGAPIPQAAGWWLVFLVFVIGGERLEFGGPRPRGVVFPVIFWASLVLALLGGWFTLLDPAGKVFLSMALVLCAVWKIANDKTVWTSRPLGQMRFLAASLAAGYGWLAAGGLILIADTFAPSTFTYDMTIHAIVLGLGLSMVFGHALVVLPSILHLDLPFSPALYIPLLLLEAGVALRIAGGLAEWPDMRMLSGLISALAIASFAALIAGKAIKARLAAPKVKQPARA